MSVNWEKTHDSNLCQSLDPELMARLTIERGFFELFTVEPLEVVYPPPGALSQQVSPQPDTCVYFTFILPNALKGSMCVVFGEEDANGGGNLKRGARGH